MQKISITKKILLMLLIVSVLLPYFSVLTFATEEQQVTIVYEEQSKRTATEKHYLCSDGNYVAVAYHQEVHYLDESGVYRDIDNTLTFNEETGGYENKENPVFGVSFSAKGEGGVTVLSKGRQPIGYTTAVLPIGDQSAVRTSGNELTVLPGKAESVIGTSVASKAYCTLPSILSEVRYENVGEELFGKGAVAVEYTVNGNTLKENVVLYQPTSVAAFETEYSTDMTLTVGKAGELYFTDAEGTVEYTVEAPYIYDAVYNFCEAVEVTAEECQGGYTVRYTPQQSWLSSEERVYPVTFDPLLYGGTRTSAQMKDTYYSKVEWNDLTNIDHDGESILYIEKNGISSITESIGFFALRSFPDIDYDYYDLLSAEVTFKVSYNPTDTELILYRAADPFRYVGINDSVFGSLSLNSLSSQQVLSTDSYCTFEIVPSGDADEAEWFIEYSYIAEYFGSEENPLEGYLIKQSDLYKETMLKSTEATTDKPVLAIFYTLKEDLEGRLYTIGNGGSYLAYGANGTPEMSSVQHTFATAWYFHEVGNTRDYVISPFFDQSKCLTSNNGSVVLTTLSATPTNEQIWVMDKSGSKYHFMNKGDEHILCNDGTVPGMEGIQSIDESCRWTLTIPSDMGVYTFKNVAYQNSTNKYLGMNGGFGYKIHNQSASYLCLVDEPVGFYVKDPTKTNTNVGANSDKGAFRVLYTATSDDFLLAPISSNNGRSRVISCASNNKLVLEDIGAGIYTNLHFKFSIQSDGSLVLTTTSRGSLKVLTASGSSGVVISSTGDSFNNNQKWIMSEYMFTPNRLGATPSGYTYTEVEEYYRSLNFGSPFGSNESLILTSDFGKRINGDTVMHLGIDLQANTSTGLYSPANGTVVYCHTYDSDDGIGPGTFIVVKTEFSDFFGEGNIYFVYMHMSSIANGIQVNTEVSSGSFLGYAGETGANSAHLHYQVFVADSDLDIPIPMSTWLYNLINPLMLHNIYAYQNP